MLFCEFVLFAEFCVFTKFTWLPKLHFLLTIIRNIGKFVFACNHQLCQMFDGSYYNGFQTIRIIEYCVIAVSVFENTLSGVASSISEDIRGTYSCIRVLHN